MADAAATSWDSSADTGRYGTFDEPPVPPADAPSPTRSTLTKKASLLSRLFFLWFEYLVDISKTRPIRGTDVWQLDEEDRSAASFDVFMAHTRQPRDFLGLTGRLYWSQVLASALLSLVGAVAGIVSPFLIYVVIAAVTNEKTSVLFIVGILVLHHAVKLLGKLAHLHSGYMRSIVATRTIGALQTLMFDVTLSSTWSRDITVSETSNLFYELTSVQDMLMAMHGLWLTPLSLAANLALLYYIIGDAVLGSIIAAVALQVFAFLFKRVNSRIAKRLLKCQERRLQVMSESFKTIQSIKLHAWEYRFLEKIRKQRKRERSIAYLMDVVDAMWRSVLVVLPELILATSFAVLVPLNGGISFNPAMAFASLSIVYRVQAHLGDMHWLLYLMASASVTLKQVLKFLEGSQRKERAPALRSSDVGGARPVAVPSAPSDGHRFAIRVQQAAIGRKEDEPLIVMANLTVSSGSLTVIHGPTGAGKSSLLDAMVDSALVINAPRGSVRVIGRVAYCSQNPWLQTLSIRENILFGLPYDEKKYLNVLHACCLLRDIGALARGDETVVGPKGLTLSGGQKSRIALARACYADADVYLLDSPLASVDAIVQSDIFHWCFVDLLKRKTVVLVTHNVEIVSSPYVDQVVHVKDHRLILQKGPQQRSVQSGSNRCILTASLPSRQRPLPDAIPREQARPALVLLEIKSNRIEKEWRLIQASRNEQKRRHGGGTNSSQAENAPLASALLYVQLCGGFVRYLLPLGLLFAFSRAALIAGHLWICAWSATTNEEETKQEGMSNVKIFVCALAVCAFVSLCGSIFAVHGTTISANVLFDRMVQGLLFAPMAFFYDQPIGEIMNRFSGDVQEIDEKMACMAQESVFTLLGVVMPWLVLTYALPEMLFVAPPLLWLLYRNRHQMKIALEMLRLEAKSYSPCFEAISEAIDGRHLIQAFGPHQVARFRQEHHRNLDKLLQIGQADSIMRNWCSLQFFKVDTLFLAVLIVAVLFRRDSLIPLFGLALHYVVSMNGNLFGFYWTALGFLSGTIKIQNIQEYGAIVPEQGSEANRGRINLVPPTWPIAGEIDFQNVTFQYDDATGPVLQEIQLQISPGEKIGLVGRTGAGKSSLTMALFRIHDLVAGRILIDGVDIALVDLYTLRSRLSIIPQSPLFFQGPLRSYLDPFGDFDDVMLWESLRKTGLAIVVSRMEGKLLAALQENAENLSLGERQLLCLSRVLLKRSKVVVLDEATAAIDHDSDETLQRVLKDEFKDATVISIAHRLESIQEFDRVIVMDGGRIVQCGRVEELVADANGPFFDLLESALLKM